MQSERERQSVRTLATEMEQENDRVKLAATRGRLTCGPQSAEAEKDERLGVIKR